MIFYYLKKDVKENGLDIELYERPDHVWEILHKKYGDEPSFSVTCNIPGIFTKESNIAETSLPGLDVQGSIAGHTARTDGQFLTAMEGTPAQGVTIQYTRNIKAKVVPVFEERPIAK